MDNNEMPSLADDNAMLVKDNINLRDKLRRLEECEKINTNALRVGGEVYRKQKDRIAELEKVWSAAVKWRKNEVHHAAIVLKEREGIEGYAKINLLEAERALRVTVDALNRKHRAPTR